MEVERSGQCRVYDGGRATALLIPWKVAGRGNVGNRALILSRGQLAKTQPLEASPSGMSRSLSSG